jgi:dipeptidyl-peptidase-3
VRLQLKEHIYAVTPESALLVGKPNQGHVSNYYLGEIILDEEVADIQTAAEKLGIDLLNTRSVCILLLTFELIQFRLNLV